MSIINPIDCLRMRADMRDRFRDPLVRKITSGQWEAINDMPIEPNDIGSAMTTMLDHGKTYRVEQQMTKVIIDRAMSMPGDTPFAHPPEIMGFCVFEEPIRFRELRDREELIHVLVWGPAVMSFFDDENTPGILISTWNDLYREPDEVYLETVAPKMAEHGKWKTAMGHMGRWSLAHMRPIVFFPEIGPPTVLTEQDTYDKLRNDEKWTGPIRPETPNNLRYFSALFEMLGERIPATKHENAELSRTEKKQAKREGLEPEVILVTLRPEFDPTHHDYRSGTGRTQKTRSTLGDPTNPSSIAYYRTIHRGTPRERKVPVRAHYRGPDDGPPPTPKVYNLGR